MKRVMATCQQLLEQKKFEVPLFFYKKAKKDKDKKYQGCCQHLEGFCSFEHTDLTKLSPGGIRTQDFVLHCTNVKTRLDSIKSD